MRKYRSETRKPANIAAEVTCDIGAGFMRQVPGTVQDVSSSGMGLLVPLPFTVGASVKIVSSEKTHSAVVRRCVPEKGKHILGVKLEP